MERGFFTMRILSIFAASIMQKDGLRRPQIFSILNRQRKQIANIHPHRIQASAASCGDY